VITPSIISPITFTLKYIQAMKKIILLLFVLLSVHASSQTLIMNEVSNGPSGNQEYVEFVVASNTVTYSCTNSTPPCIDIRGWIFDDNSGLHGGTSGTGVAPGAVRFSQDNIWACVPLGTIILIYNNSDRNPAIPPDDISMADGNCTIIAPISNASLFEVNSTTPGASTCSYPATGWVAGGNWNNTVLANGGDCARVVSLAGCEVFSVCYGSANTNNLIYFAGSGAQKVFYFNGVNPSNQANWTSGSASPAPGAQTPGAPNNAANAAYIGQFNNNCTPITPIAMNTPTAVNAGCTCNGSATVTASGSIGPYTYVWYDNSFTSTGQTGSTATGLCAGVYKVIATSHIGCSDTATVTIGSTGAAVTLAVNSETICSGNSTVLTASTTSTGGTYSWTPGGQTTQTISVNPSSQTTYTVSYSVGGCSATAVSTVAINSSPTASMNASSPSLCSSGQTATLTLSGSSGTYSWSNGATTSTTSVNAPGIYTATVSTAGCGNAVASVTITTLPNPTVSITAGGPTQICSGGSVILTASSSDPNYSWSNGSTTQTVSVNTATTIVVTTTNSCGTAQATETITVTPLPTVTVSPNAVSLCSGQSATVQATANTAVTYTWSTGVNTNTVSLNAAGIYTVDVSNTCGVASATVDVSLSTVPSLTATASQTAICSSGQTSILTLNGSAGTYSWSNGATTSTTSVNAPGIYTATVSTAGCGNAVASVTITTLPNPTVSITAGGPTQICSGGSVILTASSSDPNYSWSNGSTTQTVSVNTATTIVVTTTNSCGAAQATETIALTPLPTVTVSPNAVSLCSGQNATVQATANTAVTYTWSTGVNTNTVSLNAAGIYTVDVSNTCGAASATVNVSLLSAPSITATASQTAICNSGQSSVLSLTGSTGTYLWSNGATTATTSVSIPDVYTATVTTAGCGSATTSVVVGALPSPSISVSAPTTTICTGSQLVLTANSSEGNYLWSNGATTQTISTGSPFVSVTTTNSCGSASANQTLSIAPLPTVTITPGNILLCPGYTATLTATGSASNYTWNTGATGSVIYANTPGVRTVSVSNVCGTTSASVMVTPLNFPPLTLTASSPTVCPNELVTYSVTGGGYNLSGSVVYNWSNSTSNGSVVTGSGGTVTVSNTNVCGTYTTSIIVGINPVTADISANPVSGTSPLVVTFTNNSTNASTWLWDFGNGAIANTQTVTNQVYTNSGSYTAYLTVTNGSCMDVDSVVIVVLEEEPTLYVPNAFTPNGDSINDIFRVGYTNIIQFNMIIFDRWGLKLFESSDINTGWDGKVNGNVICDGVYYYLIDATGIDEVKIKKQGTVTLFK
jgi:gliding motility-associated-like protein